MGPASGRISHWTMFIMNYQEERGVPLKRTLLWLIPSAVIFFTGGCEENPAGGEEEGPATASLSFVVGDSSPLAKGLTSHVQIDTAKILLRTIQFHNEGDSDSLDFKTESFVLDLDLSGGLNTVAVQEIPEGSYNKVSFRIHKPEEFEDVGDPDFYEGDSGSERFSVVVKGMYGGQPFTFKSRRTAKQRINIQPALMITDTTTAVNVTLSVDVHSWFVDPDDGALLNPTDEGDESAIDDAIKESFRAYRDDDKDGDDS